MPTLPGGGSDAGYALSAQEKEDLSPLPSSSDCENVTVYIGKHSACEPSKCPILKIASLLALHFLTNFFLVLSISLSVVSDFL